MPEIEATLLICGNSPQQLIDDVITLQNMGIYHLSSPTKLSITDCYFDTLTGTLSRAGFNLRIRTQNEDKLVTLKGNPIQLSEDVSERMEIERPWSPDGIQEVLGILSDNNVVLEDCKQGYGNTPREVLNKLGLDLIQKRQNNRTAMNITDTRSKEHVAELAVDQVTYQFGPDVVCHYELEVEVKDKGNTSDVQSIIDGLKKTYPSDLHPWLNGKLSTGLAIESLCKDNRLQEFIRKDDSLPMAAYNLIHAFLAE
ncbi:MAG: CYTH domain-containing protein [Chloroflexota bacterium]|nr:CYTH domain-containing protein [Chloroflexota bacterium]